MSGWFALCAALESPTLVMYQKISVIAANEQTYDMLELVMDYPSVMHPQQDSSVPVLLPKHTLPDSAKGYSPLMLEAYDMLIVRLSATLIWRCPTPYLLRLYSENLSHRHLEAGVGTGYFLEHGIFPTLYPQLTLLDCHAGVLAHARRRLSRYKPTMIVQDLTHADWPQLPQYSSIGLNLVYHALAGNDSARASVLQRLAQCLTSDGVLFGSTVLAASPHMSGLARKASQKWLAAGKFNNKKDTPEHVEQALRTAFDDVQVQVMGYVLLFVARRPKRDVFLADELAISA